MRSRMRRWVAGGALVAAGASVFQIGTGCASFAGEQALIATDFCFIFDCQNGAFGGTLQPCQGAAPVGEDGQQRFPLFVDCVTVQP